MTDTIKQESQLILEMIKNAKNILLHCHPNPDPDSIGSALAMRKMLLRYGKEVNIISGDSVLPVKLSGMPGINTIVQKNYFEINHNDYDLFIVLDSSSITQISQLGDIIFPATMKTIVIDHHATNTQYGNINLVDKSYSSTSEILYDLFSLWNWEIDQEVALNLFMGIFGDTGGLKYLNTSPHTFDVVAKLVSINPHYQKLVFDLENNKSVEDIELMGIALSSIDKYMSGKIVISSVPYQEFEKRGIGKEKATKGLVGDILRSVIGWDIVASLVEYQPNTIMVSLRTRDEEKYDVSIIAKTVGENGGGHRGASGTTILLPLSEAKELLVKRITEEFQL